MTQQNIEALKDAGNKILAEVWNSLVETATTAEERTKAVQLHRDCQNFCVRGVCSLTRHWAIDCIWRMISPARAMMAGESHFGFAWL